jgi:hypothetical protein
VLLLTITNILFVLTAFSQSLTSEQKQKAAKEAKSESEKLQKKGWVNNLAGTDLEASFVKAYEAKYTKDKNDVNYYVPAFGNAIAGTKEEAEKTALIKCKKGMFDIMMFYFYSWNTTNKKISDTEIKQVEDALKTAGDKIKEEYFKMKYETVVSIYRQKNEQFEMQLRIIYNQQDLKNAAKNEIKKVLASKYSISEERGEQMLTYPK